MRLLESEPDALILSTVDFMMKADERFRREILCYARFKYQEELERKENQHLKIVKTGGEK